MFAKLIEACEKGDLQAVRDAVDKGASITEKDDSNRTLLHIATMFAKDQLISEYLLSKGVNVSEKDKFGKTALHYAAHRGCYTVVDLLLKNRRTNVLEKDEAGYTALYYAVSEGNQAVVERLLDAGASVIVDKYGNTVLDIAEQKGDRSLITAFLATPTIFAKLKTVNPHYLGRSALYYAASIGYSAMVERLLDAGASVIVDNDRNTVLHIAAQNGAQELVTMLIKREAVHVDILNAYEHSALYYAVDNGYQMIVEYLLDAGANINIIVDEDRNTVLHIAAQNDAQEVVATLLKRKAIRVDTKNVFGHSALYYAVSKGNQAIVERLLDAGASVIVDKYGNTVLHIAAVNNHPLIIKALVPAGVKINEKNSDKRLALHLAAENGCQSAVETLLYLKADVNEKDKFGQTALHLAAAEGYLLIIEALVKEGAIVTEKDIWGETALSAATRKGNQAVIECLLKRQAIMNKKEKYDLQHELMIAEKKQHIKRFLQSWPYLQAVYMDDLDALSSLNVDEIDINIKDSKGETAAHWAIQKDNEKVLSHLLQLGVKLEVSAIIMAFNKKRCWQLLITKYPSYQQLFSRSNLVQYREKFYEELSQLITPNAIADTITKIKKEIQILVEKEQRTDVFLPFRQCDQPQRLLEPINPQTASTYKQSKGFFSFNTNINYFSSKAPPELSRINKLLQDLDRVIKEYRSKDHVYENICKLLENLHFFYKKFSDDFHQFMLQKSQLSTRIFEEKINEYYYPTTISSSWLGEAYLKVEVSKHLTHKDEKGHIERENIYGTHPVRRWQGIHFKYHIDKNTPCFPAIEYTVGSLYSTITNQAYGIAPTELIHIRRQGYSQILIASQTVEGIDLQEYLEDSIAHPELINFFDSYHFSAMVITSLLTTPADGKADNYMVHFIKNEIEGLFQARIVGIDNDYAFADPIVLKKHGKERNNALYTDVKSVFFFFPQMQKKLDEKLRGQLLEKPAALILIDWLKALQEQDHYYQQLKKSKVITDDQYEELQLPIRFQACKIRFIYLQLKKLQMFIEKNSTATHTELFFHLYPRLAQYYKKVEEKVREEKQVYNLSGLSDSFMGDTLLLDSTLKMTEKHHHGQFILDCISELYSASAPSLKEANDIKNAKERKTLMSQLAIQTATKGEYLIRKQSLEETIDEFLQTLDYRDLHSKEWQLLMLENIKKLKHLKQLTIQHCDAINSQLVEELRTILKLDSINLVYCSNIDDTELDSILVLAQKYNLTLGLFGCEKISINKYEDVAKIINMDKIRLKLLLPLGEGSFRPLDWPAGKSAAEISTMALHLMIQDEKIDEKDDAITEEYMSVLEELIRLGANVNGGNPLKTSFQEGDLPLQTLFLNGNKKLIKWIIEKGANPDLEHPRKKETSYQILINVGLNPGNTIAFLKQNYPSIVQGLPVATFIEAVKQGDVKVVQELLLKYHNIVNVKEYKGVKATALHWAVSSNSKELVQILLNAYADPTIKDANGETPIDWAHANNAAKDIVELLVLDENKPSQNIVKTQLAQHGFFESSINSKSQGKLMESPLKLPKLAIHHLHIIREELNKAKLVPLDNEIISVVFTDVNLAKGFQEKLKNAGFCKLNELDRPRKFEAPKDNQYEIKLTADEYNAILDDNEAYAKLISSNNFRKM